MNIPDEVILHIFERQARVEADQTADGLATRLKNCLLPSRISQIAGDADTSIAEREHLNQCPICARVLAGLEIASQAQSRERRRSVLISALGNLVPSLKAYYEEWIAIAWRNAEHLAIAAEFSTPKKSWGSFVEGDYLVRLQLRKPLSRLVVNVSREDDGAGDRTVMVILVGKGGAELRVPVLLRRRPDAVLSGSAPVREPVANTVEKLGTVIVPIVSELCAEQE